MLYATVMKTAIIKLHNYNPLYLPADFCYLGKILKGHEHRQGFVTEVIEDLKAQGPCPQKSPRFPKMDLGRNELPKSRHATLKTLPNPLGS